MKTRNALATIASLTLALTACSTTETTDGATSQSEATSQTEQASEPAAQEETTNEETGAELQAPFGQTITWGNGHEITIGEPAAYVIDNEYIAEEYPGEIVQFEVTHTNGTDEPYSAMMPSITATSGGKEAQQVFDDGNGQPAVDIMPGDSINFTIAFEVSDPGDISLKYDLFTFVDDPAYYTNN